MQSHSSKSLWRSKKICFFFNDRTEKVNLLTLASFHFLMIYFNKLLHYVRKFLAWLDHFKYLLIFHIFFPLVTWLGLCAIIVISNCYTIYRIHIPNNGSKPLLGCPVVVSRFLAIFHTQTRTKEKKRAREPEGKHPLYDFVLTTYNMQMNNARPHFYPEFNSIRY